ncbi:MAG: RNA polymerase sigma factor [Planctomycetota bacterium]|jgi:DNA-directed RNA polymerase specialized sigma24 family protein
MSAVDTLSGRMRAGDREAAAEFIVRYGPRLQRRIRSKLSPAVRRLFDSQDLLSTLSRRLDAYVAKGQFRAADERETWALVTTIAENAAREKARLVARLRKVEGPDSQFAQHLLSRASGSVAEPEDDHLDPEVLIDALESELDKDLLRFWLRGYTQKQIAEMIEISYDATRKRWERIKKRLIEHFNVVDS